MPGPRLAVCLAALCAGLPVQADDAAETEAVAALDGFIDAWNAADLDGVRDAFLYPHVTVFDGFAIAEGPEEVEVDFAGMRARGWDHSSLGPHEIVASASGEVHVATKWARHRADGEVYRSGRVFYVLAERGGRWGIRLRAALEADAPSDIVSEILVANSIGRYFADWNRGDNAGTHEEIHFPHVFALAGRGAFVSRKAGELDTDFEGMREKEGWDHSTFDAVRFFYTDSRMSLVYLTFHRRHADGVAYRSSPVLWVMTKDAEGWGIQFRSILSTR